MKSGVAYDRLNRFNYPYREVLIDQPDGSRVRLDAYDPGAGGQIVSRKFTQLADVQEQTAFGYLRELATKYRRGYHIANVPSSGPLAGQPLAGQQYLEVPIQLRPIPQAVLDLARSLKITIRDVTGRIYR
jgi:filamentous hemagglutinin